MGSSGGSKGIKWLRLDKMYESTRTKNGGLRIPGRREVDCEVVTYVLKRESLE